ncbi:MAG: hypothetical protein IJZ19_15260 [Lentisphaeria bacterium]|nr:hypothetical protein [Lentisphaeria bacterium]
MKYFDFICPLCNKKLKIPFAAEGEICNCPFCDGEIVPVFDEETIQRLEQKKQAQERIKQEKIAATERIIQEKEAQLSYQQRCKRFCSSAGQDFHKTQKELLTSVLCHVFVVINILGCAISLVMTAKEREPIFFVTAIICAIDAFVSFAAIEILKLFQFQVQNSFRIAMLLDEISQKIKK